MRFRLALVSLACACCCSGVPIFSSVSEAGRAYAITRGDELKQQGAPVSLTWASSAVALQVIAREVALLSPTVVRDRALFEMFSGKGGLSYQVHSLGYKVVNFERKDQPMYMDACTLHGAIYAVYCLLSVAPSGSAHFAPQCSTWWIGARGHTHRDPAADVFGTFDRTDVSEANWILLLTWGGGGALPYQRSPLSAT